MQDDGRPGIEVNRDGESVNVRLFADISEGIYGGGISFQIPLNKIITWLTNGGKGLPVPISEMWIPNIEVDEIAFDYHPPTRSFGLVAACGLSDESGKPQAGMILWATAVPHQSKEAFVMGLSFEMPLDLGKVPLFGSMLTGFTLKGMQITWATETISGKEIFLPNDSPWTRGLIDPAATFQPGLMLGVTLAAGDAQQTLLLPIPNQKRKPKPLALLADTVGDEPAVRVDWIPLQQAFGPLYLNQIGIASGPGTDGQGTLGLGLDASLALAVLGVNLRGFVLAFPVTSFADAITHPYVSLDGLNIWIHASAFTLSGGLVKHVDPQGITEYIGGILVQAQSFGLSGLGSFASMNGHPSVFLFAMVHAPIGGPPYFHVSGLAGGFGFNRGLRLPGPADVQNFPLVQGARDPGSFGDSDPMEIALQQLTEGNWIPPQLGNYWLAAGIEFSSFEVINAFALLTASFGKEFEIALFGIATIELPPAGQGSPYIYAELGIQLSLQPEQGIFNASAVLSNNSYVIDRNCRLTGGFAFLFWFGNNLHAGEFVLTLGGYNPVFDKPDYYPAIEPLGIAWNVSSLVTIRGGAYFALTPSCVMAGGGLDIRFDEGDLKAWFTAHADFLISWKPFWYDVAIGVSLGASYTTHVLVTKTWTVSLSADLHLWGPPFQGVAHIHWWVISFTVQFGDQSGKQPGKTIDWDQFYQSFLPQPKATNARAMAAAQTAPDAAPQQVVRMNAADGLLKQVTQSDGSILWQVRADQFQLDTQTAVPASVIQFDSPKPVAPINGLTIGVKPMGSLVLQSPVTIKILYLDGGAPIDLNGWRWTTTTGAVPQALWDTVNTGKESPSAKVMPGRLMGLTGRPIARDPQGPPNLTLKDEALPGRQIPTLGTAQPAVPAPPPPADPVGEIGATLMDPTVVAARQSIAQTLGQIGISVPDQSLTRFVTEIRTLLVAPPMIAALGSSGPAPAVAVRAPAAKPPAPRPAETKSAERPFALQALVRQYARRFPEAERGWRHAAATTAKVHHLAAHMTRHDHQLLTGFAPDLKHGRAPGSSAPVSLSPGVTLLWERQGVDRLGDQLGQPATLRWTGRLALRLTQFDAHYRLLSDETLPVANPWGHELAPEAVHLALTCLHREAGAPAPAVSGWSGASSLIQVTPQLLLGEGAIIRPQSPHRIRLGRTSLGLGSVTGTALALANLTETGNGTERGWIETHLADHVQSLILPIRRTDGAPADRFNGAGAVDLTVRINNSRGLQTYESLEPITTVPVGPLSYLLYDLTAARNRAANVVLAKVTGDWYQDGLLGLQAGLDELPLLGSGLRLVPGALANPALAEEKVAVMIQ